MSEPEPESRAVDAARQSCSSALLVVTGLELDPAVVTRALGREPSQAWRRGDRKSATRPDGTRRYFDSFHACGGWKLWEAVPHEGRDLGEQLQDWAELLRPMALEIQKLCAAGNSVELNCCVIASDSALVEVPGALQADFGAWGVDLSITFYAHDEEP